MNKKASVKDPDFFSDKPDPETGRKNGMGSEDTDKERGIPDD